MMQTGKPIIKDKTFGLAAYQQIEAQLRAAIQNGQWNSGEMIPGRRDLAKQYAVNAKTIQRALEPMLADGTLRADTRRGTFVGVREPQHFSIGTQTPTQSSSKLLDRPMVIGIITKLGSDEDESGAHEAWKALITNSLERAIGEARATSHFINRFRPGQPSYSIEEAIHLLLAEGLDGLVFVMPWDAQEIALAFSLANQKQLPIVFINTIEITLPVPSVYCGDRDAGYQAADHLLQRGCRNLLFFAPYTSSWGDLRLAGARETIFLKGLPPQTLKTVVEQVHVDDIDHVYGTHVTHDEAAYRMAQTLLATGLPAEGIIAVNDACAFGFHQAATEAGYVVGRDYALVGFDDSRQAQRLGITSLHPPLERLGQEATRAILRALTGNYITTRTALNFTVVARRSSHFLKQPQSTDPIPDSDPNDTAQSIPL